MSWQQLVMQLGDHDPDAVEALLVEHGAVSVTLTDGGNKPVLEPAPGETPLWQDTRITGLFPADCALDSVIAALSSQHGLVDPKVEHIEDRAWEREWLKDFGSMRFGRRLWVSPKGMPLEDPEATVVELDPGLAFGTGTHATTALCLEWLDGLDLAGQSLIDYGCGSGILAIAALKLGARHATGYDIDPQAIVATRSNAADNGVDDRLEATIRTATIGAPADVVVANILAAPLTELATEILDLTITGGKLALSGILSGQVDDVAAAYAERVRFDPPAFREQDGQTWARLTGTTF